MRRMTDSEARKAPMAGKLLDLLLVLLQGLHVLDTHGRNAGGGGLVAIDLVTENADGQRALALVGQSHGAGETLVLGGIVVLEANLQLDRLGELALLGLQRVLEDRIDGLLQNFGVDLGHLRKVSK